MTIADLLFPICVAGSVGCAAWLAAAKLFDEDGRRITSRLNDGMEKRSLSRADGPGGVTEKPSPVADLAKKIALLVARPFMPEKSERMTGLRKKLAHAGIYDPAKIRQIAALKLVCMCAGLAGGVVMARSFGWQVGMGAAVGGLLGYVLPMLKLKLDIKANQKKLDEGLPDALDLMVICVEAGLTIDATLQRVGDELALAHPAISRELGIAHMETRIGVGRQHAFRNLADRTGHEPIRGLVAMLVQADRFGTSIATALRVHADAMRSKRMLAAEEIAGKASAKMTLPLVLFIFPASLIVFGGPAFIGISQSGVLN